MDCIEYFFVFNMFLVLLVAAILILIVVVESFSYSCYKPSYLNRKTNRSSVLSMADKTPLVTSAGKRVEVDGGSSLMAVILFTLKIYEIVNLIC